MYVFYSYVSGGYHNFGLAQEMILSVGKMVLEKHQNLGRLLNFKFTIYTLYFQIFFFFSLVMKIFRVL